MPTEKDLSTNKETHMSVSLHGEVEFHVRRDDQPDMKPTEGESYWLCFPVKCTSVDEEQMRFMKTGLPELKVEYTGSTPEEAAKKLYKGQGEKE